MKKYNILFSFAILFATHLPIFCQTQFITTWKTDNLGPSGNNEITIPAVGTYDIYWEEVDNAANNGTASATDELTLTFPNAGTYRVEITGGLTQIQFAFTGDRNKILSIEQWGNIAWMSMNAAFQGCFNLTHNAIDAPNLANVTDCSYMFSACFAFTGEIGNWNVSPITNMEGMLEFTAFNGNISSWNVGNVTNMNRLFKEATVFSQDIGDWDVSKVTTMVDMLESTAAFDYNIGGWNIGQVTDMTDMLRYAGLSARNYDRTLEGWASQTVQMNVPLGAENQTYCLGEPAKNTLINDFNWNITDDAPSNDCPFITTWKTDNEGTTGPMAIRFPGNGTYDIYWEEVGNPDNSGTEMGDNSTVVIFPNPGIYQVEVLGGLNYIRFNDNHDRLKLLSIENWGDIAWTSMESAFYGCQNMTCPATDVPDLSNVNNCFSTFRKCYNFNGDISDWNVSQVTSMASMFRVGTLQDIESVFNADISGWNTSNVTEMQSMFRNAVAFNQDISGWNTEKVTNMRFMFNNARNFNQDISGWNTAMVADMNAMFLDASAFNQNLGNWNIEQVADMGDMLINSVLSLQNYDSTLEGWAVQTPMANIALGASGLTFCASKIERDELINTYNWTISGDAESDICCFITTWKTDVNAPNSNQISIPGVGNYDIYWEEIDNPSNSGTASATGTYQLVFPNVGSYLVKISGDLEQIIFQSSNSPRKILSIEQWGDIAWTSMAGAFGSCHNLRYNATDVPDLSQVSNYTRMFSQCFVFNGDIGNWDVSQATTMERMFYFARTFNQDIGSWNVANVINMERMFEGAEVFNQDINGWNVGQVQNMNTMFQEAIAFNQDLNDWNTSEVTNMSNMFDKAIAFNGNISSWNTAKVTDMSNMFAGAVAFNQDLNNWDVCEVLNLESMFNAATTFNGDISSWILVKANTLYYMFEDAAAFNQDISGWDVSNITDMEGTFSGATAFNQSLGNWDISKVEEMSDMLSNSGLSRNNYDATLMGWESQSPPLGLSLDADGLEYCNASAARDNLLNTYNWTIGGDALNCSPLSVELTFFEAKLIHEQVVLEWQTFNEMDNAYFVVERSEDGKHWISLAQMDDLGFSNSLQNYQHIDQNPVLGQSFYRLKQVDKNGAFEYSEIRTVVFEKENAGEWYVYPNPTADFLVISNQGEIPNVKIFTIEGQVVNKNWKVLQRNNEVVKLDVSNLANGGYWIYLDEKQPKMFFKFR